MDERLAAPYGSWKSPLTAQMVNGEFIGLRRIVLDGEDIYWGESRPGEGGRNVVVHHPPDGSVADLTPPGFNVRSRVHEYGGGDFTVADSVLYFVNFDDQRLYRQHRGGFPEPLTPDSGKLRYADFEHDRPRNRLLCIREDHTGDGEAVNTIVAIDLAAGGPGEVVLSGYDFYAGPRLNPDGDRLAWLSWRHPNMPWDGTELWLADIGPDGQPANARQVAGGLAESIFQPAWSPQGVLHFASDRTGWWNLYRLADARIEALCPMEAEFGQPQWGFDQRVFGFQPSGQLICAYNVKGVWRLARLDAQRRQVQDLPFRYDTVGNVRVSDGFVVMTCGAPTESHGIVRYDLRSGEHHVLRQSQKSSLDAAYVSVGETLEFPTAGGKTAFAYYYRPRNPQYAGPITERPPLIVMSHGGPTGSTVNVLDYGIQYWTSRGFAVLDVNYGGSTGYGREYRERLKGQWGVVDLEDCVNGARYLVETGEVDGRRLAITGGSAGGYTTLCALTFSDVFAAGASYYGISDLGIFTGDTHKFESRYMDSLVGKYPERKDLYEARSPINFIDRLSCPLILFQGLDDPIVPPNQAEIMFEAVRRKGLPVAYIGFPGEQHGFRDAKNMIRAMEAELYFYGKVFGFEPADEIEPVPIENL